MNYEQAHEAFIEKHLASRTGERRGRLERASSCRRNVFTECMVAASWRFQ